MWPGDKMLIKSCLHLINLIQTIEAEKKNPKSSYRVENVSVVECVSIMCNAVSLIPSTAESRNK